MELNKPVIKSIINKCISNYCEFLSKNDQFISSYGEIDITNNINDGIVSSHTIRNYSYLLKKHCASLTDTIINIKDKWNVFPPEVDDKKVNLATCIINHIERNFIPDIAIELTANKSFLLLIQIQIYQKIIYYHPYIVQILYYLNVIVMSLKCVYTTLIKIAIISNTFY